VVKDGRDLLAGRRAAPKLPRISQGGKEKEKTLSLQTDKMSRGEDSKTGV